MTPPDLLELGHRRTTSSHTISLPYLSDLLRFVPAGSSYDEYAHAIVELNILGRPTHTGRLRVLRHLRELYGLDDEPGFRLLRELYGSAPDELPLLAGLLALTQDEFLRASWPAVESADRGARVASSDLAAAIESAFGRDVAEDTYAKAGRNVAASWTQTGHLAGARVKTRARATNGPAATAFAVCLGYVAGRRGPGLLDTPWFAVLDLPDEERRDALDGAHRAGLIDVRSAGSVLEIDPTVLLVRARAGKDKE
ncbi:hypothetical protein [Cellulomonas sp. PSBB021]|uniref:hypothetical protein n=1 Tax=Cellulomonas sp. PSBB021 TaxID=2003551 RepID=UPI000B8D59A3|nr:hypothetical protein [Cellulomonas sp. PSBB021]ASR55537.1 hypothetical protein CBP52_11045 [Cellulomonas sp. PSBB021]